MHLLPAGSSGMSIRRLHYPALQALLEDNASFNDTRNLTGSLPPEHFQLSILLDGF